MSVASTPNPIRPWADDAPWRSSLLVVFYPVWMQQVQVKVTDDGPRTASLFKRAVHDMWRAGLADSEQIADVLGLPAHKVRALLADRLDEEGTSSPGRYEYCFIAIDALSGQALPRFSDRPQSLHCSIRGWSVKVPGVRHTHTVRPDDSAAPPVLQDVSRRYARFLKSARAARLEAPWLANGVVTVSDDADPRLFHVPLLVVEGDQGGGPEPRVWDPWIGGPREVPLRLLRRHADGDARFAATWGRVEESLKTPVDRRQRAVADRQLRDMIPSGELPIDDTARDRAVRCMARLLEVESRRREDVPSLLEDAALEWGRLHDRMLERTAQAAHSGHLTPMAADDTPADWRDVVRLLPPKVQRSNRVHDLRRFWSDACTLATIPPDEWRRGFSVPVRTAVNLVHMERHLGHPWRALAKEAKTADFLLLWRDASARRNRGAHDSESNRPLTRVDREPLERALAATTYAYTLAERWSKDGTQTVEAIE